MAEGEFQTRSDDCNSLYAGITNWDSFGEAYLAWTRDPSIWKISFTDEAGHSMRWRPKTHRARWSLKSENKLGSLCAEYSHGAETQIFWVRQSVLAPHFKEIMSRQNLTSEEQDELLALDSILECVPDNVFSQRYFI